MQCCEYNFVNLLVLRSHHGLLLQDPLRNLMGKGGVDKIVARVVYKAVPGAAFPPGQAALSVCGKLSVCTRTSSGCGGYWVERSAVDGVGTASCSGERKETCGWSGL